MNAGILAPGYAPPVMPRHLLGVPQPMPMPYGRAGDPYWQNVVLMLRMDGLHRSRSFSDLSKNAYKITASGDAQVSSARSPFGGSSGAFDGSGDYVSTPMTTDLQFGTGAFTFEAWVFSNALAASKVAGEQVVINAGGSGFLISLWQANVHLAQDGIADLADWASPVVTPGRWFHLAITRSGTSFRCFVNGTQAGTTYVGSRNFTGGANMFVGAYSSAGNLAFNGNLFDVRLTKGVARYVSNYAPTTAPLPTF